MRVTAISRQPKPKETEDKKRLATCQSGLRIGKCSCGCSIAFDGLMYGN